MKNIIKISTVVAMMLLLAGSGITACASMPDTELAKIDLDVSSVKELDLDTSTGTLRLYEKEGISQIEVYIDDKESKTSCSVEGNTLKIRQKEHRIENYAPRIEVLVPPDYQFDWVSLETGMGGCEVKGISTTELEMSTGMGNAVFSGTVAGDVVLDTGKGDVTLNLIGKETDYNYNVDCGAGFIQIGETKYPSRTHYEIVDNETSRNMELDCASGNITIAFTDSLSK